MTRILDAVSSVRQLSCSQREAGAKGGGGGGGGEEGGGGDGDGGHGEGGGGGGRGGGKEAVAEDKVVATARALLELAVGVALAVAKKVAVERRGWRRRSRLW